MKVQFKIKFEMKYRELVEKAKNIKSFIHNELNTSTSGRFEFYVRVINDLANAYESKNVDQLATEYPVPDIGFALKELTEIVSIFEFAQMQIKTIRPEEKDTFKSKLKSILRGPAMTHDETPESSHARNYQFELRLAAKFYDAGYTNISYDSGHDLVVKIRGRKYAIECKRVTTDKTEVLIKRTNIAIEQLVNNRNFYAGIVALDITQKFENGINWVVSDSRANAANFVAKTISDLLDEIHTRDQKIKTAAKHEELVAIIGNLSCAYLIEPKRELGWLQQNMFFLLGVENTTQVNTTKSDLSQLKIIEGEKLAL